MDNIDKNIDKKIEINAWILNKINLEITELTQKLETNFFDTFVERLRFLQSFRYTITERGQTLKNQLQAQQCA